MANRIKQRNWTRSRFDSQDEEPLGPLANLVDIMLVFDGFVKSLLRVRQHFYIENITWLRPLQVAFKHRKIQNCVWRGGQGSAD